MRSKVRSLPPLLQRRSPKCSAVERLKRRELARDTQSANAALGASGGSRYTERGSVSIPRQDVQWDERRNSSRVFPVPPEALGEALAALKRLDPALRRWIEDGAPRLTDYEHQARFGETYHATRPRRR